MIGALVNAAAIALGSLIGLAVKKGLPERISSAMQIATALAVFYVAVDGMLAGEKTLVLILSLVIGGILGAIPDLDGLLRKLGDKIENKFKGSGSGVAEGFVSASLLFCVGAMAIVGPLQSGLTGNHETQFTKAVIDGIAAIVFASTLGWGVMLSAIPVLLIQGSIALLATAVAPILSTAVIAEMTCVGSVLILAIALNMLGITKIKVMNFTPAVFVPLVLCMFI